MSKSWLITGVSSGLGRELADAALAAGGRVVGTLRRQEQVAAFEALAPGRATAMILDVTDAPATAQVVREAWDRLGGIDVLVNNAGYGLLGCLEELSDDDLRRCMDTNFGGTLATIRAVLPLMRERGRGDILNFSSVAGLLGIAGMSGYSAAKFAVEGLSDALSVELAPFGIRVMAIEPGGFRTQFSLGSLATSGQAIAAYDGTPGGITRSMMSRYGGTEKGDPAKLARLLVQMVDGPDLPSHFACGADGISMYRRRLQESLATLDRWQAQATSTDFEPKEAAE
jgi:NAD(P)-dependent dehydrogenase (short-subunit alcohol dehydrogenase family)